MGKVYIVGAKRTAIGNFGGSLGSIPAAQLSAATIKAALKQAGLNPEDVDETIIGNVLQGGQGMGPGRQAAIFAGIPVEKVAYTVNIICGSGMKSVMIGATDIIAGNADVVVAGGTENMSLAPYLLPASARFGAKMGHLQALDYIISDGLTDVFNNYHMGITAENIAKKHKISREAQDEFACASQAKAVKAIEAGKFQDEIVPVEIKVKKETINFATDEYPRKETTLETLAKLRPAFDKEGTVTAGNASGINDGASSIILASEKAVKEKGLKPLAELVVFAEAGVDPAVMGLGPVPAVLKLLAKANMKITEIDLFEFNEAFAVQSLGVLKELAEHYSTDVEAIKARCNVNGGAIALGHPLGASGNRIITTLLYEMKKRKSTYGVASLCIGGGMGTAVLIKNLN